MRERSIKLSTGETTRVREGGPDDAPTLVLVHALPNSIEIWDRVFARLSQSFRTIAFDLPGFGQASRPLAKYDGAFFAEQLKALLDALELDRPILVGNSLGASIVLRLATIAPDRMSRVVLAAPGGFGRKTNLVMRIPALPVVGKWLGRPTPRNNALTLRLAVYDSVNITPELADMVDRYAAMPGSEISFVRTLQQGVTLLGSRDRASVENIARRFPAPALVIWGRQDRVFPMEQAERAVQLLPQSELQLIDKCGHYPHWEQPDTFAAAIERFCR